MPQVIRHKETGQEFVGEGPVPDGFEVVTKPGITEADIGAQMLRNAQRQLPAPPSLTDMAKGAAMPTIAAIGGGMLGQRLGGQGGRMVGEMAGSTLGTGANMLTGLQPPSLGGLAEAAAAPLQGRLFGQATQYGLGAASKMLPGSAAVRHELAKTTMDAIPDLVRPGTPSSVLYQQIERSGQNTFITPTHLRQQVADLLDQEAKIMPGLKDSTRQSMLSAIAGEINDPTKTFTFTDYWKNVKRIGEKVGSLQTSGGEALGAAKLLYKAAMKDMDASALSSEMRAANATFKKELAADALQEIVTRQGVVSRGDGLVRINPTPIRKWLRSSDEAKFLDAADLAKLDKDLAMIERLPAIPPQSGVMHGAGPFLARGAMGGLVGQYMGGPQGAAVGASAMIAGSQLVSQALMTALGRKALMMVLDRGPFLDYPKLAALAVAINAGMKAEGDGESSAQTPVLTPPRQVPPDRMIGRFDTSQP